QQVWRGGGDLHAVRKGILVVVLVQHRRQRNLPVVVQTTRLLGLFLRLGERRQQHRRKNRDNRDDHQQFNQGKRRAHEQRLGGNIGARRRMHTLVIGVLRLVDVWEQIILYPARGLPRPRVNRLSHKRAQFIWNSKIS